MTYNPDLHHRRSIRLPGYDYSAAGAYFVTVCAQGRQCLFGTVINGVMQVNDAGRMVEAVWHELPERFIHVTLDECVVMPNHFHCIVLLPDRGKPRVCPYDDGRGESCIRPESGHKDPGDHKDRPYGTMNDSLGRIIQVFKSLTTNAYIRGVKENGWPPFPGRLWQRNFYERVIRDDAELAATREYIAINPDNWAEDEENVP